MQIRKLTSDDAQALRECRLFGLNESPEAFLVSFAEVAASPVSSVESELRDSDIHYLGAFQGEEMVGCMRYVRASRLSRRHTAEVRSVYVKQSARGRGVGSQLLLQLVRDARAAGLESLNLSVLADNAAARRMYESCGFRLYGMEPRAIRKADQRVDQAFYRLDLAAARLPTVKSVAAPRQCRRCGLPIEVHASEADVFEGMHWLCFHLEFEHSGDPDAPCTDPSCPWLLIEAYRAKLVALGCDPARVALDWSQERYSRG